KVWWDYPQLRVGDSLRAKIDEGLNGSRYGIVILSEAFFAKRWPVRELNGLFARESEGRTVVLPILKDIAPESIAQRSPILADKIALCLKDGLDAVVAGLMAVSEDAGASAGADVAQPSDAKVLLDRLMAEHRRGVLRKAAIHLRRNF